VYHQLQDPTPEVEQASRYLKHGFLLVLVPPMFDELRRHNYLL